MQVYTEAMIGVNGVEMRGFQGGEVEVQGVYEVINA